MSCCFTGSRHSKTATCAGTPPSSVLIWRCSTLIGAGAAVLGRVHRDIASGMAPGEVQGTPTLFIDGVVHRGGHDAATLMEALAR
jgi:hypothetical protein